MFFVGRCQLHVWISFRFCSRGSVSRFNRLGQRLVIFDAESGSSDVVVVRVSALPQQSPRMSRPAFPPAAASQPSFAIDACALREAPFERGINVNAMLKAGGHRHSAAQNR